MLLDHDKNRTVVAFIRGLGILLVICFHVVVGLSVLLEGEALENYISTLPGVTNIFWQALGSELIFLASGFLLSYLLIRELRGGGRIAVREFYIRRLSRIVPMYLIGLGAYALVREFEPGELVLNLIFVSKWFDAETIIPVGWSLEVLVQSYMILPWLVILLYKTGKPVLLSVLVIAVSVAVRGLALWLDPVSYQLLPYELIEGTDPTQTQDDLYYLIWFRFTPFMLGFLLAHLVVHEEKRLKLWFAGTWLRSLSIMIGIGLVAVSGFLPIHDRTSTLYQLAGEEFWLWFWTLQRLIFGIGICVLALGLWHADSLMIRPLRWLTERRIWTHLSANIYSVYLFHPIFLIPAAIVGFRATAVHQLGDIHVLEIIAVIVLVTAISLLLARFLTRRAELPAQRWVRRRLGLPGKQG